MFSSTGSSSSTVSSTSSSECVGTEVVGSGASDDVSWAADEAIFDNVVEMVVMEGGRVDFEVGAGDKKSYCCCLAGTC